MPREGHIKALRDLVGTMPLFLPSVAVFVRDGDQVLVGRHRDVQRWVVPGGALEPGELPSDCAVREVWEETGLHVRLTSIRGVYGGTDDHRVTYPNGDVVDYVVTVFDAEPVGGAPVLSESEELTDICWVTIDELRGLETLPWMGPMLESRGWEPGTWQPGS